MGSANNNPTYGVIAQFADSDVLMRAAQAATRKGYTRMDAYSPVPVHGLDEALGRPRSWLGWIVLCAGLTGARYTSTTEVYPDSPRATPTQCVDAQVAAVRAAIDYVLAATA